MPFPTLTTDNVRTHPFYITDITVQCLISPHVCYSEAVRSGRSQRADVQMATPPPPAVPPASLFRQQHQLTAATGSQGVKFPPTAPNQPPPPSQLALHFPAGRQPRQLPAWPGRPAQGRQSSVLNYQLCEPRQL